MIQLTLLRKASGSWELGALQAPAQTKSGDIWRRSSGILLEGMASTLAFGLGCGVSLLLQRGGTDQVGLVSILIVFPREQGWFLPTRSLYMSLIV